MYLDGGRWAGLRNSWILPKGIACLFVCLFAESCLSLFPWLAVSVYVCVCVFFGTLHHIFVALFAFLRVFVSLCGGAGTSLQHLGLFFLILGGHIFVF